MKLFAVVAGLALLPLVPSSLTSPAFRRGGAIPKRFTCDVVDLSTSRPFVRNGARVREFGRAVRRAGALRQELLLGTYRRQG